MKKPDQDKQVYVPAKMVFEGGGIRRGLTPPEAALLLGKPFNFVVALLLFILLYKGFIECLGTNPIRLNVAEEMKTRGKSMNMDDRAELRRHGAQKLSKVLYPFEEPLLELLEQYEGENVAGISFSILQKPLDNLLSDRINGYDLEKTSEYYQAIIHRTISEISPVSENVKERDIHWLLLDESWEEFLSINKIQNNPAWLKCNKEEQKVGLREFLLELVDELKD